MESKSSRLKTMTMANWRNWKESSLRRNKSNRKRITDYNLNAQTKAKERITTVKRKETVVRTWTIERVRHERKFAIGELFTKAAMVQRDQRRTKIINAIRMVKNG